MLEKMGWREGCGLGARLDGPTSHIKISVKEDLLGIGASRKDAEGGWLMNSKSYQEVLDRLAQRGEDDGEEKKAKKKSKDKKVEKKSKSKKSKKDKSKKSKEDKKDKSKKEKKDRPLDNFSNSKDSNTHTDTPKPTSLTTNARAHRAKFIRNKSVASYSSVHLQEILGGINL